MFREHIYWSLISVTSKWFSVMRVQNAAKLKQLNRRWRRRETECCVFFPALTFCIFMFLKTAQLSFISIKHCWLDKEKKRKQTISVWLPCNDVSNTFKYVPKASVCKNDQKSTNIKKAGRLRHMCAQSLRFLPPGIYHSHLHTSTVKMHVYVQF